MKTATDYLIDALCGVLPIALIAAAFLWINLRRRNSE
jgi:hypothetical protein